MASEYESKVYRILKDAGVKFKREYTFKDLKSYRGKRLRYDFAVFNYNNQLECLIEVHGAQHYQYIQHFHKTKQQWNYAREMDLRKAHYAITHYIPFYVIPYTDVDKVNTFADLCSNKYKITTKWYLYQQENTEG